MDKDDARKLTAPELHERRRQVIRAFKRGVNKRQISVEVGLSYPAVRNIIARHERDGVSSLRPGKRGRKSGDGRSLSDEQAQSIQQLICDKRPEQLKMDFALWNRAAVGLLIEREYGIAMRQPWSTPMCGVAVMRRRAKRQSRLPWGVHAKSFP